MEPLGGFERAAVARRAVQMIVDALGDFEEAGVAVDDQPSRVDAGASGVREQSLQELGDPASARARVHVDDPPPFEVGAAARGRLGETVGALRADQRGQPFGSDARTSTSSSAAGFITNQVWTA